MNLLVFLLTYIIMEGITWCTHKYVMHGFLWTLHDDHHNPDQHHFFERNDWFFVIFSIPSMLLIFYGFHNGLDFRFWMGIGILAYGISYVLVHDIFIHQRFSILRNSSFFYFQGLRKAHKIHHKHLGKEDGECFGMLFVPVKYFKEAILSNKNKRK